jgi:hypothetical protein
MPDFTSEIEVYVDEFVDSCSRSEKQELIDILVDEGWVRRIVAKNVHPNDYVPSLLEIEWNNTMNKLSELRQRITLEEEEMIKNLVTKYT